MSWLAIGMLSKQFRQSIQMAKLYVNTYLGTLKLEEHSQSDIEVEQP